MTEEERKQIVDEVIQAIGNGAIHTKESPKALEKTFRKWFRGANGGGYGSKIADALDGNTYGAYSVWDTVRKTTCQLCGCKYVRQIKDVDRANEIADAICQKIYDLAIEEKERKNDN